MARPVPRRRAERDAPAADEYTSRRGRKAADDEPDEPAEERRPRRGRERGALPEPAGRGRRAAVEPEDEAPAPSRRGRGRAAAEEEPAAPSRRRGRSAPEPEPEEPYFVFPSSRRALDRLSDAEYVEVAAELGLDDDEAPEVVWEAVEDALESLKEDEPEPPRRGRGRAAAAEEPPARGRGRGRAAADDDEDEENRPSRIARRGMKGFKKVQESTSQFADDFKLTEEEVLVKFLPTVADAQHVKDGDADKVGDIIAADAFATYGEHGLFQELKEGQRVWTCLEPDDDCPICATGHKARPVALWNIIVMPEEGKPQLKVLKAGPKLEKLLEKKAALKTGPLDKEYYSLSQTDAKDKGPVEYTVELVRERDLADPDGWDTDPLTEDDIDTFLDQAHDATFVQYPSVADLKKIARELRDRD